MAKQPMVTRTIKSTVATVMCVKVEEGETLYRTIELTGAYKTKEALLKKVKSMIETDTLKCIHIADFFEKEALYGMTEHEFMTHAEELPPRTKNN